MKQYFLQSHLFLSHPHIVLLIYLVHIHWYYAFPLLRQSKQSIWTVHVQYRAYIPSTIKYLYKPTLNYLISFYSHVPFITKTPSPPLYKVLLHIYFVYIDIKLFTYFDDQNDLNKRYMHNVERIFRSPENSVIFLLIVLSIRMEILYLT